MRTGAYLTDSRRLVVYEIPFGEDGALGSPREIALSGIALTAGNNLNGIERLTRTELLAVQSSTAKLWRIDRQTGAAREFDANGFQATNGDGLLIVGRTLLVVQNRLNRIAVLELAKDRSEATFKRFITNSAFDVPTTVALVGKHLVLPNARFGVASPDTASYSLVAIKVGNRYHRGRGRR